MDINSFNKNIARFVILVLIQVLILNNIHITNFGFTPYLYIVFLLLLPYETQGWLVLLFSFILGISIDMFDNTGGIHALATVFAGFSRPLILRGFAPRDGYNTGSSPSVESMGFQWFLKYSMIIVFIHHFIFFVVEAFSFTHFPLTLLKIGVTTIFSTCIIILSQFLVFKK